MKEMQMPRIILALATKTEVASRKTIRRLLSGIPRQQNKVTLMARIIWDAVMNMEQESQKMLRRR